MLSRRQFVVRTSSAVLAGILTQWSRVAPSTAVGTTASGAPKYWLVLDQASHMDWDWNLTHTDYLELITEPEGGYQQFGVVQIIDAAVARLVEDPVYRYSLCEGGFLRSYVDAKSAAGD